MAWWNIIIYLHVFTSFFGFGGKYLHIKFEKSIWLWRNAFSFSFSSVWGQDVFSNSPAPPHSWSWENPVLCLFVAIILKCPLVFQGNFFVDPSLCLLRALLSSNSQPLAEYFEDLWHLCTFELFINHIKSWSDVSLFPCSRIFLPVDKVGKPLFDHRILGSMFWSIRSLRLATFKNTNLELEIREALLKSPSKIEDFKRGS